MLPYISIGVLSIPSYGLCMVLGIVFAFLISYFRLKKQGESMDALLLVGASALLSGLIGSVLAYFIFSYGMERLFRELFSGNFSAFENVGMVYYGGLIGGIAGAILAIRLSKMEITVFFDAMVPTLPLGHAFGRIGCLLAGCCYGRPYAGAFAVHSAIAGSEKSLFPIQAVESGINFIVFFLLCLYVKRNENRRHNTLVVYLLIYSIERFIIEFFRGDAIRGVFWGLSSSQWISIALLLGVLIWHLLIKGTKYHNEKLSQ